MSRSIGASWLTSVLAALGATLAIAALDPEETAAQLRDPPLGWDMWDPRATPRQTWRPEPMDRDLRWRMTRHQAFIRDGVPPAYRGASNPLTAASATLREGGTLYAAKCAGCHDASGLGEGNAGRALYPSPALLAHLLRMPQAVDEYLFWAISEGGEPFGTAMPAFKEDLSEAEIWQIITYMRAGFPQVSDGAAK